MKLRLLILFSSFCVLSVATVLLVGIGNPPVDRYRAIDGDTLERLSARCALADLGLRCLPKRFQLDGIEALELGQTCWDAAGKPWACGDAAHKRLSEIAASPDFKCLLDDDAIDRRQRSFGDCILGGRDVAETLIREGFAFALGRRSRYSLLEVEAKQAGAGAWAGRFVRPQYYRFTGESGNLAD